MMFQRSQTVVAPIVTRYIQLGQDFSQRIGAVCRRILVSLQGLMTAVGFCIANLARYGSAFSVGDAQWRIPLAMQIPVPFILMFAVLFVPFSPRWLVRKGRHEEARRVLSLLHDTESEIFIEQELLQIQQQIELEVSAETSS
ncbi:hypothetical protein H9Q72_014427 [Fusarium xylarioides]|uniref:Major facilitator superfamily (MFS) profile domain-containing protein n=1 Tax=Fusarium xylarioides TaxID=221167 RepID=A0A9P7HDJ6_9HYPO|nr:hypothetical protein H9Q72_014427 [Fusarium xylarioides]